MALNQEQRCILITGAASGIGRAAAIEFSRLGWFVGAVDLDASGLDTLALELNESSAFIKVMDVCDIVQWHTYVEGFSQRTQGRLNVLFNNAGLAGAGWFEDVPQDLSQQIIRVNLMGAVNGVYACRDLLNVTERSHIINNGSILGLQGTPFGGVYGATKAALINLTESLNLELERDEISVSILLPSFVDTALLRRSSFSASDQHSPGLNLITADQVAQALVEVVRKPRLYMPVGHGSGMMFRLVRWCPSLMRWLTRRWLLKQLKASTPK